MNVFFLELIAEPLIDLIFGLRTLYDVQPVTARSAGVDRCQHLDPVSVFDHVIDRNKLTVDLRTDHTVADCRMNAVGKIDRCRTLWKVFDITGRCKAEHHIPEQVQIVL